MNQRNLGASVRQRLLDKAHAEKRPFQELLQYYAMERFLYRLAQSPHAKSFVLKGALLLTAWRAPLSRPTMDIDFAGKTSNDLDHIREVIAEVCDERVEDDGLEFVSKSISASRIKEDADYEGVRIRFHGLLAGARIPMQIDIGFGDVIVPEVVLVTYPTLLEFPNPILTAYPKETVIAEKLEALTSLGLLNSRIKDYFDLWLLSRLYEFDGAVLLRAIMATFSHRETTLEFQPVGLTDEFASDPAKDTQWKAFLRRSRFDSAPEALIAVTSEVRKFVGPVLAAAVDNDDFATHWMPGRGWEKQ
jgi:predicted nucleotidyltransferase component of viral defense system